MRCFPDITILASPIDQKKEKDLFDVVKPRRFYDVFKDILFLYFVWCPGCLSMFHPKAILFADLTKEMAQASDILNYNIACTKGE